MVNPPLNATIASSHSDNRFHILLAALLAQILASPFLTGAGTDVFQDVFFLLLLIASVHGVRHSRLYPVIFALTIASVLSVLAKHLIGGVFWDVACDALGAAVVLLAGVALSLYLARQRRVNLDTVLGGLCVYLFMGAMWFLLYGLVNRLIPDAFAFTVHHGPLTPEMTDRLLFFFSYVTLMTIGYGDIVPLSPVAQVIAVLEGLLGQFYLVFFMARLVGLHVAAKQGDPE
ncbi:Ion transport 2 domain protein [Solidesulfovibrio fructosivorans JJ]]|uniref:Ion transport 2 domain protein n=1 Tax=Solidesulfovibrio fructosivorans JJ] TaxID=596151 RepID=E1JUI2_SOLFR|nr:potassium channel family protein [Solidesulfovibrio fructosivorans]EFL52112.1 Ion transport 2 domain protein [Solidesulfovibrio fructosivorans JJ]]